MCQFFSLDMFLFPFIFRHPTVVTAHERDQSPPMFTYVAPNAIYQVPCAPPQDRCDFGCGALLMTLIGQDMLNASNRMRDASNGCTAKDDLHRCTTCDRRT